MREIHAAGDAQQAEDALEAVALGMDLDDPRFLVPIEIVVAADPDQLAGDPFRVEDVIERSRWPRCVGHAVVLGRLLVLGEGDPAFALDGLEPERAVGAAPGEDDPDRPAALVLGQRSEQVVDRHGHAAGLGTGPQRQRPPNQGHVRGGRQDIDVIGPTPPGPRAHRQPASRSPWRGSPPACSRGGGRGAGRRERPSRDRAARAFNSRVIASSPPAEAPTPTTGKERQPSWSSISEGSGPEQSEFAMARFPAVLEAEIHAETRSSP